MTVPTLRCSVLPVRSGAGDAALVVLGPSLGTTSAIWDEVAHELSADLRVLRFDLPGHGFSPAATESFSMSDVAVAVLALVDSIGGGSFYYAGDSMGSAVGLTLAAEHPSRVRAVAAFAAPATYGDPAGWLARAALVRSSGTSSVVSMSASRWFAPDYLSRHPGPGAAALDRLLQVDDESYALCCEALAGYDLTAAAPNLTVPALFAVGRLDIATPPDAVRALAELVPGARFELMEGVGHLPVLEDPPAAEALVRSVLSASRLLASNAGPGDAPDAGPAAAPDRFATGMRVRREVLGDRHVDAANERITPETADFQEFLTRYAWGEIWDRPGLGRRERSLITLSSLVTGGHENEIAMHIRAALTNGLTRAEISEAIMHTALYAGLPAANSAFAIARDVFARLDAEPGDQTERNSHG
jgi:3-oxoadipate enol-lactonase/4-carboxymuconolactone decarboxylase